MILFNYTNNIKELIWIEQYYKSREDETLEVKLLPTKGERKKDRSVQKRGKQVFKRSIHDRLKYYPNFATEFAHFQGDKIIGKDHKSCVITLVEKESKVIVTLKTKNRTAKSIEEKSDKWLDQMPIKLVKSITFDCRKEFPNWKNICNKHDISIFFADSDCPSQRG